MTPTPRWLVLAAPAIAGALLLAAVDRPAEAMKIHPLHDHVLVRVADTDDPEGMGRIQVVFPVLPEPSQSPMRFRTEWARLLLPLAGADGGTLSLPEVGDEVLVGFVGGDVSRPVIVGRLWNGDDPPPESR